jgi:hypothetical protein
MEYLVIQPDGRKIGPVDEDVLKTWASEGRIASTTPIERFADGVRLAASQIPALTFVEALAATAGPPPVAASQQAVFKDDPTPVAADGAAAQSNPWVSAPAQGSRSDELPYALDGMFNWGAFWWHWWWGLWHKAFLPLVLLPYTAATFYFIFRREGPLMYGTFPWVPMIVLNALALPMRIYCGLKGYRWAWKSDRYAHPDDCIEVQRRWTGYALAIMTLLAAFVCLVLYLLATARR